MKYNIAFLIAASASEWSVLVVAAYRVLFYFRNKRVARPPLAWHNRTKYHGWSLDNLCFTFESRRLCLYAALYLFQNFMYGFNYWTGYYLCFIVGTTDFSSLVCRLFFLLTRLLIARLDSMFFFFYFQQFASVLVSISVSLFLLFVCFSLLKTFKNLVLLLFYSEST